jgi:cytoskeletal protein CcmA (bactofilin family)
MWNRDESKPATVDRHQPSAVPSSPNHQPIEVRTPRLATLGSSILIAGTVTGSEDLTVDGRVKGRIELPEHALTIGPNANITADIVAKVVTVFGTIKGNITARDSLELRRGASVESEVTCTRISIQEGAAFSGKVAMEKRRTMTDGADIERAPRLAAAV